MKTENDERGGVEEGAERPLRVVAKVVGSRVEGGEEVEEGSRCAEDGDDVGGKVWRHGQGRVGEIVGFDLEASGENGCLD